MCYEGNEKYISTLVADGVALAAIKALHDENSKLKEKLEAHEKMLLEWMLRIEKIEK